MKAVPAYPTWQCLDSLKGSWGPYVHCPLLNISVEARISSELDPPGPLKPPDTRSPPLYSLTAAILLFSFILGSADHLPLNKEWQLENTSSFLVSDNLCPAYKNI